MSLKNLSAIAGNNTLTPPFGAPESSTKLKDYNDLWRYLASVVRHGASSNTIASAATTDLGSLDETWLTVSGAVTITSFGTVSAGIYKFISFSGALTLTHNATSLILLGGVNRTTVAGDCGLYLSLGGGNWKEYFYSPIGAYQPLDPQLTTLAGITAQQATDLAALSTFMGTLLNDADASSARATLQTAYASDAEAQALTDALKVISPLTLANALKGTNQSLAGSGYQKLPGGVVLQWGTFLSSATAGTATVVTFPIAFPGACYGVFPVAVYGITSPANSWIFSAPTLTQVSLSCSIASVTQYWFAVGI